LSGRPATLLDSGVVQHLIGVVDLKDGCAVHAVAGKRGQYQPVSLPGAVSHGNPQQLVDFYAARGLSRLYIADLDAIERRSPQTSDVRAMLENARPFDSILLDLGWRGDEDRWSIELIARWATEFPNLCVVAATESAVSPDAYRILSAVIGNGRVFLGLDYRGGKLIGKNADENLSIRLATDNALRGIVVLDLESVGTSAGPTTAAILRRVKQQFPDGMIVSGGGIRSADDALDLIRSGCDHCLVATALHDCR
jgi:phosphoribosylformimino-5-aminoimidazole carboxamide ribotide isomerase